MDRKIPFFVFFFFLIDWITVIFIYLDFTLCVSVQGVYTTYTVPTSGLRQSGRNLVI